MEENTRIISSPTTFATKFILPIVLFLFFGFITYLFFGGTWNEHPETAPPEFMKWFMAVIWIFSSFSLWRFSKKIKKVSLKGDTLFISNFRETISVPVSEVKKVIEHRWQRGQPITLEFYGPTKFGSEIMFLPRNMQHWQFWKEHPIARELHDRAIANFRP